ncbi:pilus assembly protein CpaB [Oceanobacillus limi]|uniref:Pilus assembly protein CpaB n=1 Tax=Oceanobacillus limi TaxID=930131 RepID=A0A1I0DQA3_9BACI|nr:SAF domain-containing protein [Oceanobacillus limi]SET34549.1 pilus assembly protein CpaB [Oceanobacillus limi]
MLESKRRAIIFFVIAIILAAISGYLILKKVQTLNSDLGTMVHVYVASKDIHSRALITPADLTTEEIPKKFLRDEHITELEEFKNTVSVVPLSSGQMITDNMLKKASAVTEVENRLITLLQSDKVFFDEELADLDRVDIIISKDENGEKVTEVFMEDVKVARIARSGSEFSGVQVEVPFEKVTDLIHMQNYAESMRIIRSNVGQMPQGEGNSAITNESEEESTDDQSADESDEIDE